MADLATELQKMYKAGIEISIRITEKDGFRIGFCDVDGCCWSDEWYVWDAAHILPLLQEKVAQHFPDSAYEK